MLLFFGIEVCFTLSICCHHLFVFPLSLRGPIPFSRSGWLAAMQHPNFETRHPLQTDEQQETGFDPLHNFNKNHNSMSHTRSCADSRQTFGQRDAPYVRILVPDLWYRLFVADTEKIIWQKNKLFKLLLNINHFLRATTSGVWVSTRSAF